MARENDSLILAGQIELLGGGSVVSEIEQCAGAVFTLGGAEEDAYNLGAPQPVRADAAALLLDGEFPRTQHYANRVISLPVMITAPDGATLAGAREVLMQLVSQEQWDLVWTRDGGLPLVFDCFAADPVDVDYSLDFADDNRARLHLTFPALPYGRSETLETLDFDSPSSGWTPPPDPVVVDDFATVSSTTQAAWWSQVNAVAAGGHSAMWSPLSAASIYTRTLGAAKDISGPNGKLSLWLGLTALDAQLWNRGKISVKVTLTDNAAHTLTTSRTFYVRASRNGSPPHWQFLHFDVPYSASFAYTNVTAYSVTCWNRTTLKGGKRMDAVVYLNAVTAQPPATGTPGTRGALWTLLGKGTARGPFGLQVQPPPAIGGSVATFTALGAFSWTAVGTAGKVECWGPSGGSGGGASPVGYGGAGSGGGEYSCNNNVPFVAGVGYNGSIGGGGAAGAVNGDGGDGTADTWFTGASATTVRAHPGKGGKAGTGLRWTGQGLGGSGSTDPVHYPGGDGYPITGASFGAGGGSSAGTGQAGNDAPGHTGAPAPTGGAAGGDGGDAGEAGHSGGSPGGGAGGGATGQPGAAGRNGKVKITYGVTTGSPLKVVLAHIPGPDAPHALSLVTAIPAGAYAEQAVPDAGSLKARFDGTYTVYLFINTWNNPTAARDITVRFKQYDYAGGTARTRDVSRTGIVPSSDISNGVVEMGVITLPLAEIAPGNTDAYFTEGVNSTNGADTFLDVVLADTAGQTILVNHDAGFMNYWFEPPALGRGDLGAIFAASTDDQSRAQSVLDSVPVYSGGPMMMEPAGMTRLLMYSPAGVPAARLKYLPRWWLDRLS